jgi:hypothetical protein
MINNKEREAFKAWLATLKHGDMVAIAARRTWEAHRPFQFFKIDRTTPTQLVIESGRVDALRISRESGYVIGRSYDRITAITPAVERAVEEWELKKWLSNLHDAGRNGNLSIETLRALKAAHDAHEAAK